MKKYTLLFLLSSLFFLAQAQKPWRAKLFFHFLDSNNTIVTDTVWFGCDSLGDIGFQQGLDVFDTIVKPNKVLAFDSLVQIQYNTGCVNLKQNIKQLKRGIADFTFYAFGDLKSITLDSSDFLYKVDSIYWLTSALMFSKNAYLDFIDASYAGIANLVDTVSGEITIYKDSIAVISENPIVTNCIYLYPTVAINLWVNFGYRNPYLSVKKNVLDQTIFRLYPNPIVQSLHINLAKPITGLLTLTNATGKQVYEKELNQEFIDDIDCSAYPSGFYYIFFKDSTEHSFYTQKIIIQH